MFFLHMDRVRWMNLRNCVDLTMNTTMACLTVIKSPFPKYEHKSQVYACSSFCPEDLGHILIQQSDKPHRVQQLITLNQHYFYNALCLFT